MLLHNYYLEHKFDRKYEFELENKFKKNSDNINNVEFQISTLKDTIDALNKKSNHFRTKKDHGSKIFSIKIGR